MSLKIIIKELIFVGIILSLASCGMGSSASSPGSAQSGPQIEAKSPGIMKRYHSFHVDDVNVYSVEGDYFRRVDDREVRLLADEFRSKLIRSLGDSYSPISQPSMDTAVINVALTDVSSTYAAFQIVPGVLVPNAMRGGASIEATIMDSVSGEPIARIRDSRHGERQGFLSGFGKWDGTKRAFDEWAQMLASAVQR